jgi:phosphopentomutase
MKRAILIVMDGCGAGEAPDAAEFGDLDHPSTLLHVWNAVGGFSAPFLQAIGFLRAGGINAAPDPNSNCQYGRLKPLSKAGPRREKTPSPAIGR